MYYINKKEINSLYQTASKGCKKASEDILMHFIPLIQNMSSKIWYLLHDETSFEQECYQKILLAIDRYNVGVGRQSFADYAMWRIHEVKRDHLKRRRREQPLYIEARAREDGLSGVSTVFELRDSTVAIEQDFVFNEKITLMAEGDFRKTIALKAWSGGFYDTKDISTFMAERFGGKVESHRKLITRFKLRLRREHSPQSLSS